MPAAELAGCWIEVNGLRVFTRRRGVRTPGDLPFVLVHGAVISGRYMVPTARHLAGTHEVFVPDLPGYGRSDKPARPLDVAGLANALRAWMQAAGIPRAHLLGNSLGTQVIVDVGMRYPEVVESLVLVGPTVDRSARSRSRQLVRLARDAFVERPSLIPLHVSDIFRAGWTFAIASLDAALNDAIEEKLPLVTAPTLVVCGSKDPLAPVEWCTWLAQRNPRATLQTIEGPHALNYSRAGELTAIVTEWIARRAGRVAERAGAGCAGAPRRQ